MVRERDYVDERVCEHNYVDERLCGVNDMTFKEWLSYQDQMLWYYSVYQYDNGL